MLAETKVNTFGLHATVTQIMLCRDVTHASACWIECSNNMNITYQTRPDEIHHSKQLLIFCS